MKYKNQKERNKKRAEKTAESRELWADLLLWQQSQRRSV